MVEYLDFVGKIVKPRLLARAVAADGEIRIPLADAYQGLGRSYSLRKRYSRMLLHELVVRFPMNFELNKRGLVVRIDEPRSARPCCLHQARRGALPRECLNLEQKSIVERAAILERGFIND